MSTIQELLAQKAAIESQIQARKNESIVAIKAEMDALGITVEDLGGRAVRGSPTGLKRPVKYRDEKGNTWTGIGQRPRWLQKAMLEGRSPDSFAIQKAG